MANDLNKTRIDHLFSADIDLECCGFTPPWAAESA